MAVIVVLYVVGFAVGITGKFGQDQSSLDAYIFPLLIFIFPAIGVLIASQQPRNPIGWIMLGIGMAAALGAPLSAYLSHSPTSHPLPGAALAAEITSWSWVPVIIPPVTFLILLFPDGHVPSPRWRPVVWMSALAMILPSIAILFTPGSLAGDGYPGLRNPLGIPALEPILHVLFYSLVLVPISVLACAAGMVMRFRRSRGRERLQLKWLATAAATVGILYVLAFVLEPGGLVRFNLPLGVAKLVQAFQTLAIFSFALIPISIGVAILRHRLYDIDRIISRTLAYTLSVGLLAGCYFGLIVLASTITPLHSNSPVVVALVTLLLAAAFRPLLTRVRRAIDHRFNRARYNAALILDDFTRSVRDQVDIVALSHHLIGAVDTAMEPSAISLWLNDGQPEPLEQGERPRSHELEVNGELETFINELPKAHPENVVD